MRIVCLLENTQGSAYCTAEHGLSVYVETEKHRLLSDAGQTLAVLENAKVMGVDLRRLDSIFLSHGHYDHSGALIALAEMNPDAKIYMQRRALDLHVHGERDIGIDPQIAGLSNLVLLDDGLEIDAELSVFSQIQGRRYFPVGNTGIESVRDGVRTADDFSHEQCLVVRSEGKSVLLSGCAHNGILNILDRYRELYGGEPDLAVTGFHMMKNSAYTPEEVESIRQTAYELKQTKTVFWSGHCTGLPAFDLMKEIMGDQLRAMHSGQVIY